MGFINNFVIEIKNYVEGQHSVSGCEGESDEENLGFSSVPHWHICRARDPHSQPSSKMHQNKYSKYKLDE